MKLYIGVKQVKAKPMIRGAYCDYQGWNIPEGEDPSDEGYLVEYLNGGKSNHKDHEGYISWSPKDVFEESYKEIDSDSGSYVSRLYMEHSQLAIRTEKLKKFILSEGFESLREIDRKDLKEQLKHMQAYLAVILRRVGRTCGNA